MGAAMDAVAAALSADTGAVVSTATNAGLARLNALPPDAAAAELAACCASRRWVAALSQARPFADVGALYRVAADQLAALAWSDVREALDAHPRIGERTASAPTAAREAAWSRAEQSGAGDADSATAAALAAANAAYEAKFGYVFLIRATGRTATEMIAAALDRLDHDELTEQVVVRDELGQIVRLRLDKLLAVADLAEGTGPSS
jgi:2-oxo-4-hydroxy-4-carboxy-5-ureidoimidazoline decarboxylase